MNAPSNSFGREFDAPTITFIYVHNIFYQLYAPTKLFPLDSSLITVVTLLRHK